jgi:hypothetical protein
MVIQGLTQRTAPIETAICNAKWKPRNAGHHPKDRERDGVRITEREVERITEGRKRETGEVAFKIGNILP